MTLKNTDLKNLTDIFTEYIRNGIKKTGKTEERDLGVELEHFVLYDDTSVSVPYGGQNGVKEIIIKLMECYPEAEAITGEDILGFITPQFNITLEPAAQIEISIVPTPDLEKIGSIYSDFNEKLTQIIKPMGIHLCTLGCQPVSHVDDLELIPKGRYRLMDAHFKTTGTGGREMMRGTASTQVSIDYVSEEDFSRKLRAAYFYTPFFKLISDRVRMFQNEPVKTRLKRTDIWNRTDPSRCGVIPGVFKKDYGFIDYAEYLCSVPLIFLPGENGEKYTGSACAPEIFKDRKPDKKELEHVFSMPFPDVRVKKYLEIRGADAMPLQGVLSFCALVKGLLYSGEVLDHVQKFIYDNDLDGDAVRETENSLMEEGFDGKIYGMPARDFSEKAVNMCERNLSDEDKRYLHGWDLYQEFSPE